MKSHWQTICLLLLLLLLSRFFSALAYCFLWWGGIVGYRHRGGRLPFITAGGNNVGNWHWQLVWRTGFGRSGRRRRFKGRWLCCDPRGSSGDERRDLCLVHSSTFFHRGHHGLESLQRFQESKERVQSEKYQTLSEIRVFSLKKKCWYQPAWFFILKILAAACKEPFKQMALQYFADLEAAVISPSLGRFACRLCIFKGRLVHGDSVF